MVAYEGGDTAHNTHGNKMQGWFFWNFKMEGGAFAEWDFLRGVEEGWIPPFPSPSESSYDRFGSCESIIFRTVDDMTIVNEFPDPTTIKKDWQSVDPNDDVVLSHGQSLLNDHWQLPSFARFLLAPLLVLILVIASKLRIRPKKERRYTQIST